MEKWYNKFGILRKVEGGLDEDALYLEVEKILDDTLARLQGKTEEEVEPVEVSQITEVKAEEPVPEPQVSWGSTPTGGVAPSPQKSRHRVS